MRAHSLDLRQRIITAYENKEGSIRQLAERFSVSKDSVHQLIQLFRATGSIEPIPSKAGRKPKFNGQQLLELEALVASKNDATLPELCEQMYERTGIRVSTSTMGRTLERQELSRKKTFRAEERNTERVQQLRLDYQHWLWLQAMENLVFIDETGVNLAMTRLYARSVIGQRAYASRPLALWHYVVC